MQVEIKNWDGSTELGYNGIEFEVRDNDGEHIGDFLVQKARVIWCPGRTTPENGVRVPWEDFIEEMENR